MARRRRVSDEEKREILQLPDSEVRAKIDEYVEAWEAYMSAEREFQHFEAHTREPAPTTHLFEDVDSFMAFNRQRREYWKQREALRINQEGNKERLDELARVLGVLLPVDRRLIHHRAGNWYNIQNHRGHLSVSSVVS